MNTEQIFKAVSETVAKNGKKLQEQEATAKEQVQEYQAAYDALTRELELCKVVLLNPAEETLDRLQETLTRQRVAESKQEAVEIQLNQAKDTLNRASYRLGAWISSFKNRIQAVEEAEAEAVYYNNLARWHRSFLAGIKDAKQPKLQTIGLRQAQQLENAQRIASEATQDTGEQS